MQNANRRNFLLSSSALGGSLLLGTSLLAQERRDGLTEPIARTAKNQPTVPPGATPHPLDPALKLAYASLNHIRATIRDYTANLIKREQINGTLGDSSTWASRFATGKSAMDRSSFPSAST